MTEIYDAHKRLHSGLCQISKRQTLHRHQERHRPGDSADENLLFAGRHPGSACEGG